MKLIKMDMRRLLKLILKTIVLSFLKLKSLIKSLISEIKAEIIRIKGLSKWLIAVYISLYLFLFILPIVAFLLNSIVSLNKEFFKHSAFVLLFNPNGLDFDNIYLFLFLGHPFYFFKMMILAYEPFSNYLYHFFGYYLFSWKYPSFTYDLMCDDLFAVRNIFIKKGYPDIYKHTSKYWIILELKFSFFIDLWWLYYKEGCFFKKLTTLTDTPFFLYFGFIFVLTSIISIILMSYLGLYGVFFLNLISLTLFWFSSLIYFDVFFTDNICYKTNLGKWFPVSINHYINFELMIDSVSYSFMFLTLSIAVFVYAYAFSYFRYEPNVERLILLICFFVISMVLLVISGNFFVLFLGWEAIGLTSFFLINFWSTKTSVLKSAFKAFVFNRYSDASMLISLLLTYFIFNDINIASFNSQISKYNSFFLVVLGFEIPILEFLTFFLLICSLIKSAQFGFHVWLPDSMEAPVPASALIHSATLVSAGVFLLLRFSPLFEYSLHLSYTIPLIGSITAFFGGLCSCFQSDVKKILAYSTISHCGFLMICCSTFIPEYTILYLYIHGFFKAAVFLCVGNIIRFSRNIQDIKRMGGFYKYLPFEAFASFICLINLCGLPFTIGFYIKHLLLTGLFHLNTYVQLFIIINVIGGAISGIVYSYRLYYYVFFDVKKSKKIIYNQSNREELNSVVSYPKKNYEFDFRFFYTNTTLASNISISLLIALAYFISSSLFNIFLNKSSIGEGLDIYSISNSNFYEIYLHSLSYVKNIGYINWIIILVIISVLGSSWRYIYMYNQTFTTISYAILFFIFLYLFMSFFC